MTREEKIELLQDQVSHYRLGFQEFYDECKENDLDWYDDVLEPIGFNVCDRCGMYGDSELDFLWLDYAELNEEDDKDFLDALAKEKHNYCALCWECVKELRKGVDL